jgi:hypothetical protein
MNNDMLEEANSMVGQEFIYALVEKIRDFLIKINEETSQYQKFARKKFKKDIIR